MQPIVTLTTSFEEREPNVAILKGRVLSGCPGVQIVDLSHDIPWDDVLDCALFLASAIPAFPRGAVHLVDVAPGPAPIAVSMGGQHVVCPDNGVLSILEERLSIDSAVTLTGPGGPGAGQTFFGRDVFAPAAAKLAAGTAMAELGEPLGSIARLEVPAVSRDGDRAIAGEVIYINRFGNLVTNIRQEQLEGCQVTGVQAGHFPLPGISESFSDVQPGSPLAIFGISGFLEIAHNGDRADQRLGLGKGIVVKLGIRPGKNP